MERPEGDKATSGDDIRPNRRTHAIVGWLIVGICVFAVWAMLTFWQK
jgi:hypothetical protein